MTQPAIIILEDDRAQILALTATLGDLGTIHAFSDGAAALTFAQEHPVDAAVVDVHIGAGSDGMEWIRRVRTFDADLAIIVRTGDDSSDLADEAVSVGAFRRAIKTKVDVSAMRGLVREAIAATRVRRALTAEAAASARFRRQLVDAVGAQNATGTVAELYRTMMHDMRNDMTALGAIAEVIDQAISKSDMATLKKFGERSRSISRRLLADMTAFLEGPFAESGRPGLVSAHNGATVNSLLEHIERTARVNIEARRLGKNVVVRRLADDLFVTGHPVRIFGAIHTITAFWLEACRAGGTVQIAPVRARDLSSIQSQQCRVLVDTAGSSATSWLAVTVSGPLEGWGTDELVREFAHFPEDPTGNELAFALLTLQKESAKLCLAERRPPEQACTIITTARW